MRLLFIRHGDPDYEIDSLTEKGWKEAKLLAERIAPIDVKEYYVSPLGRAKDTAKETLEKAGRQAIECEWLREFSPRIKRPDYKGELSHVSWDWMPGDWTVRDILYDKDNWGEDPIMKEADVKGEYDRICTEFDKLLASYGYERQGNLYKVNEANDDTIVFFCHFGVSCVLMSHLIGCSPMVLWHGFTLAPTSVSEVYTEERQEGIASFRASLFGDISHLYVHGEPPAFSARFCECFKNDWERH